MQPDHLVFALAHTSDHLPLLNQSVDRGNSAKARKFVHWKNDVSACPTGRFPALASGIKAMDSYCNKVGHRYHSSIKVIDTIRIQSLIWS